MRAKVMGFTLAFCLALSILSYGNTVSAQEAMTLKVLCSWSKGQPAVDLFIFPWMKRIEEATGGKLKFKWMGGPEAVNTFEQLKAVQRGLTDILYTHPAYHTEVVAAGQAADLVYATPKIRHESGYDAALAEVYLKKGGVKYLPPWPSGCQYQILVNKKLDKADLKGLKIRATPFYVPLVSALGGATVQTAYGDVYDALSSGVIDGYCMPQSYVVASKLHEVTKYCLLPRYGEMVQILLVNTNTWNKIPKDLQDIVEKTTREVSVEQRAVIMEKIKEEAAEMVRRGVTFIELPPAEAAKLLSTFREKSWEALIFKPDPENGPKLKQIAEKIEKTK